MKKIVAVSACAMTLILLSSCGSEAKKIDIDRTPTPVPHASGSTMQNAPESKAPPSIEKEEAKQEAQSDSAASSASGSDNQKSESTPSDGAPLGTSASGSASEPLSPVDETGILQAFQEQYSNKDPEVQKNMTVQSEIFRDGTFFKGSISVGGRSIEDVFAIKKGDTWKIASFGEVAPNCAWVAAFPSDMSEGCADASAMATQTGETVETPVEQ